MIDGIELEIGPGPRVGGYVVRVIEAAAGGEPTVSLDLDVEEILGQRGQLEKAVLASALVRRSIPEYERPVQDVGQQLFEAVFTGAVRGQYRASLAVAQERGRRLRVILRLTAPELAALPWEMLFDPETETFLSRREPLVRHVHAPYSPEPLEVQPPLRVLGIIASPRGLSTLNADAEKKRLGEALAGPTGQGLVEMTWVEEASWGEVHSQLLADEWHVLHFIGHGGYDITTDQGILALIDSDGQADWVEATRLADLLGEARPVPRLVMLNSCFSGASGTHDLFSGTAAVLARSGISAVAAMQFAISDTAALAFARGFYTALAHGRAVDEAVGSGRISILGSPRSLEWVTPVLYLRGQATKLFALANSPTGSHRTRPWHTAPPTQRKGTELRALYVEARAELRIGHFGAAIGLLDDLLILDPDYPDADGLRDTAWRGRQLADAYTAAVTAEGTGDWTSAIRGYNEILQANSAYRDAAARRDACLARRQLADLEGELRYLAEVGQWQAVLDVDTEITRFDPSCSDLDGLANRARTALTAGERTIDSGAYGTSLAWTAADRDGPPTTNGSPAPGSYRVVAAIDFGTYDTGFAWTTVDRVNSYIGSRKIYFFEDWPGQRLVYPKNRSALLLDSEGQLLSWGYQAQQQMEAMPKGAGWRLRTGFKMALQHSPRRSTASGDRRVVLEIDAEDAYRLTVLYLKQLIATASNQVSMSTYDKGNIRWCLTVPDIWDQYSRQLLRRAAVDAGLPTDPERLLLVQESAAAALYCVAQGETTLDTPGTRFLVVAAGDSTVDVTSYQVAGDGQLNQLGPVLGAYDGSDYLNVAFMNDVLVKRFGEKFISRVLAQQPGAVASTMASWERAKRMFMPDSTNDLVIPLSAPFYAALLTEHASGTWAGSGEPATEVVVGHDLVASLFDQRVGHIIGIVEQQLGEMRSATGEAGSEVVLLVGSFAESPYLSARLGERLAERNVRIAVPRSPALAVLAGAVHYGYDSPVLLTRRAPFSIGIGLALPFRPGRDPEDMRIISDENGELCRDRFATFVASRESVQTGRIVKRTFHPIRGDQTYITFRLLRTADADPQYTTDAGVEVVGTLSIDISDSMHLPINNRTVEVAMHLGQTYIHAEARNVGTGGSQSVDIRWAPSW